MSANSRSWQSRQNWNTEALSSICVHCSESLHLTERKARQSGADHLS